MSDSIITGIDVVASAAYEKKHILKDGPGVLISLVGYNSGAAQFIQIHDSAALPANGAVPVYTFKVEATSNFSLDIPISGAPFGVGIVVCNSSTGPTKTIGGDDCWFTGVIR